MDTALNIILAVVCLLVAVPLLMQIRPGVIYRRYLDGEGNPIDPKALAQKVMETGECVTIDLDELQEEILSVRRGGAIQPEGEGWYTEDTGLKVRHYVSVFLGVALILGAFCLVFRPADLTPAVAWALLACAVIYLGWDLPRLVRALADRSFHWANFVIAGISALAITTGLRLY